MTIFHLLREFEPADTKHNYTSSSDGDNKNTDGILSAYDSGHKDGWEDCENALLTKNQDLAILLSEAIHQAEIAHSDLRETLYSELESILEAVFSNIFNCSSASTYLKPLAACLDAIKLEKSKAFTLTFNPENAPNLKEFFKNLSLELTLNEDDNCPHGSVFIASQGSEYEIDMHGHIEKLKADCLNYFRDKLNMKV